MLTSAAAAPETQDIGEQRAARAESELRFLLQLAYSGELAAIRAYLGHRHSLTSRTERAELTKIIREEVRHRHCLLQQLRELDASPVPWRERKMAGVGRTIGALCQVGGWFVPMYGAGRLEAQNVREYEVAARLAVMAGRSSFVEPLLEMAEVEWDHEAYFRGKASGHWLARLVPLWPALPPRESIRATFREFETSGDHALIEVKAPWLVR